MNDPALAALAARLGDLAGQVNALTGDHDRLGTLRTDLDQLAKAVQDLGNGITPTPGPQAWHWPDLPPAEAQARLDDLAAWYAEVLTGRRQWRAPFHSLAADPYTLDVLTALYVSWHAAYRVTAEPNAALTWLRAADEWRKALGSSTPRRRA